MGVLGAHDPHPIRSGSRGGGVSEPRPRPRTSSGCASTARPAAAAAAAMSGAVRSNHSNDSGMSSSRCLARTARTSAAVAGARWPVRGRA